MKPTPSFGRLAATAFLGALLMIPMVAAAEVVSVNLPLTVPSGPGDNNEIEITITLNYLPFGLVLPVSDDSTASGNMLADLKIAFDPVTHVATSVDELELTGGVFATTNTTFFWSLLGSTLTIDGLGIGGTYDTPAPPSMVTGGGFDMGEQVLYLNQGTFHVVGTGFIADLLPENPLDIDLSTAPFSGSLDGTGDIQVDLVGVDEGLAAYDVTLTMPIDFDEEVWTDGEDVVIDAAIVGTIEAQGQFTRVIPEPGTLLLLIAGAVGLLLWRRWGSQRERSL